MNKERLLPYIELASAMGLFLFAFLGLTKKQREAILERDEHTSQMRHYSEKRGWYKSEKRPGDKLHVHHIKSQRDGGKDDPYNLITIWEREHVGKQGHRLIDPEKEFVVHPDVIEATKSYRKGDKKAFQKMFERRNEAVRNGDDYYNHDHDDEMLETARERTDNAIIKGWRFPKRRKR